MDQETILNEFTDWCDKNLVAIEGNKRIRIKQFDELINNAKAELKRITSGRKKCTACGDYILWRNKEIEQLQAENEKLKKFLDDWDGHYSCCGSNRKGFEGCDETMFNCDCGYTEAKRQALKEGE